MDAHLVRLARLVSEVSGVISRETIPEEARAHFRASAREALLGGKAVLSSLIDQLESSGQHINKNSASKQTSASPVSVTIED